MCLADVSAADSGYGGDTMQKKPYKKPDIKSEEIDPGALGGALSGNGDNPYGGE